MPRGMQIYGRDYVMVLALAMMAALVAMNWRGYDKCHDPLNVWEFVDYLAFILFRVIQFAFQYYSMGRRQTLCGVSIPKMLAMFNLWIVYPFIWAWCILGCVWYARSGDCLPGSTSAWGFVSWLVFSFLYLLLFLWLIITTYRIRNRARPQDMGAIEHMQNLLVQYQRAQAHALPVTEGMSDGEIEGLGTRTIQQSDVRPEAIEAGNGATGVTCAICLVDVAIGEQVRDLACGHPFHPACVDQWLQLNNTCPNCRAPAVAGGPHPQPPRPIGHATYQAVPEDGPDPANGNKSTREQALLSPQA